MIRKITLILISEMAAIFTIKALCFCADVDFNKTLLFADIAMLKNTQASSSVAQ
ncbi:hypothetical protein [Psychromonas antarctica]|uniref:hypothetical protein n=1 Tax=Psychromonas antarctica TaxID=67573 RepID=UPI001EE915AB|nr:hypothetical protein [Psychromonas antarctica]MCG6202423.1 hypothetical protein [Psychromonas antarctica]